MIGGPANMYNLFSEFPAGSYAILTGYTALRQSGVNGSKWLSGRYFFYDHWRRVDKQFSLPAPGAAGSVPAPSRLAKIINHLPGRTLIGNAVIMLGKIILMTITGVWAVVRTRSNLLLGISDHGPALIATYLIGILTGRPYALHLYDIYLGNNLNGFDRALARLFEKRVFTTAQVVIVTNEGTADFYQARYGKAIKLAVIHNSVMAADYSNSRRLSPQSTSRKIIFTGHVYWAQEQAVLNLVKAMSSLSGVTLDLYVPQPTPLLVKAVKGKKNIRLLEAAQSLMPRIQAGAGLLFMPLAWETPSPDIIRTATPGKFSDYLASGRPMLVHAPDYAFVAQYSRKHQLAVVVDENNVEKLAEAIRQFFANPTSGQQLVNNALNAFDRDYSAEKNAQKLALLLQSALKKNPA